MATTETAPATGYVNGSDVLLFVGEKAVGHCTSHTATFNTETKDHAVKPAASKPRSSSLWKGKTASGQSISIKTDGLSFYDEEEFGYADLLTAWAAGKPVTLKCAERSKDTTPYLKGSFIITSLEESHSAQDDSTYSASFENDGEPEILDASKIFRTA